MNESAQDAFPANASIENPLFDSLLRQLEQCHSAEMQKFKSQQTTLDLLIKGELESKEKLRKLVIEHEELHLSLAEERLSNQELQAKIREFNANIQSTSSLSVSSTTILKNKCEILQSLLESGPSAADYQSLCLQNEQLKLQMEKQQREWSVYKQKLAKTKMGGFLFKKRKPLQSLKNASIDASNDHRDGVLFAPESPDIRVPESGQQNDENGHSEKRAPSPPKSTILPVPINNHVLSQGNNMIKTVKPDLPQPQPKSIEETVDLTSSADEESPLINETHAKPTTSTVHLSDAADIYPVSRLKRTRSLSYAEQQPWARAAREAANRPKYAFQEVVRKKDDRKHMQAGDCACCRDFYKATGLPDKVMHEGREVDRIQLVSRHRYHHKEPDTPEGYWDLDYNALYSTDEEHDTKEGKRKRRESGAGPSATDSKS